MTKILIDRSTVEQALEAMGSVGADWVCEASHHAKKDQHKWGDPCPLQQRWHVAYQALRAALAEPVQEPVAWMHVPHPDNGLRPVVSLSQQRESSLYGASVPLFIKEQL